MYEAKIGNRSNAIVEVTHLGSGLHESLYLCEKRNQQKDKRRQKVRDKQAIECKTCWKLTWTLGCHKAVPMRKKRNQQQTKGGRRIKVVEKAHVLRLTIVITQWLQYLYLCEKATSTTDKWRQKNQREGKIKAHVLRLTPLSSSSGCNTCTYAIKRHQRKTKWRQKNQRGGQIKAHVLRLTIDMKLRTTKIEKDNEKKKPHFHNTYCGNKQSTSRRSSLSSSSLIHPRAYFVFH